MIKSNLRLKNILTFTLYKNSSIEETQELKNGQKYYNKVSVITNISDYSYKNQIDYQPNNKNYIKLGLEATEYVFNPGLKSYSEYSQLNNLSIDTTIGFNTNQISHEIDFFIEDDINLLKNIYLNAGARFSAYNYEQTTFKYIDPRLSLRVLLNKRFSFKANYTTMTQYNHLIVNNNSGFEKEIWFAATNDFPPVRAQQTAAGLFYLSQDKSFDASIEAYYKKMSNLIEYRTPQLESLSFINLPDFTVKNGIGLSYGLEVLMNYNKPNFYAGLSYTLSWAKRKFQELNNGQWFYFLFDRRHQLSIISSIKLNKKYTLNLHFILATGTPFTLPIAYSTEDRFFTDYFIYNSINNVRLPIYHRLDLALSKHYLTKNGKHPQKLTINIFNVYAHANPTYIYYDSNTGKIYKKVLYRIIPTISYSIKF